MYKKITFIQAQSIVNKKFIMGAGMEIVNACWMIWEQRLQNVGLS